MAGNHEKMYNSVDQGSTEKVDTSREEGGMDLNIPRSALKVKSLDPGTKKKSFEITGVVVAKAMDHGNEECDSMDDVDETCETHTEDVSSDILDLSKNTDIEPDPSSTEDVSPNLEEPPRDPNNRNISDMTSRFKVVKIETREPFKRGRWTCLDYLDPPAEKLDKGVEEAGSGNSSAASSIHYIPGIDDPGKNPFAANVVYAEGHTIHEPQAVLPSAINIIQNGDYTPSSLAITSKSGVVISDTTSSTPPQVAATQDAAVAAAAAAAAAAAQSQPATLAKPLPSQPTQSILTPSQPTSLPASLLTSQQPGKDYVPNSFPGGTDPTAPAAPPPATSQSTNGHIPTPAKPPQKVSAPPDSTTPQQTLIPGAKNITQTSSTSDIANPTDYVTKAPDYVTQQKPNLPTGQQQDYLGSGQDFLPPTSTVGEGYPQPKTTVENVSQPDPTTQSVINPPQTNVQSDFPGTVSKPSVSAQSTAGIPPSSTTSDYSTKGTSSVPPVVSQSTGTTVPSPNNENVQNVEGVVVPSSENVPFKVVEEPTPVVAPAKVDPLPVESEDEAQGGGGVPAPAPDKPPMTPTQAILAPPLLEMVATINAGAIDPTKSDGGESGASTVAIDNKIEQAMDLVKSHLMYAVREEVEVLKEQIKELLEKNSQLEYENSILKAAATPDTITELQQRSQQQKQQQQQQQQSQQPPPSSTS